VTSETASKSLGNTSRTKIGAGEMVTLTCSGGSATWTATAGGRLDSTTGSQVRFFAGDVRASPKITADVTQCKCDISLEVWPPTGFNMTKISKVRHDKQGRPDCGYKTNMFLEPNDVSFHALQVREMDDPFVATGFYLKFNGQGHRTTPGPSPEAIVLQAQPSTGSQVKLVDEVYSGDSGEPIAKGKEAAPANFQYRLVSVPSPAATPGTPPGPATGPTPGPWQKFPAGQEQVAEINAAGDVTLTKGGESATTHVWDKPSTY
jgi:hypothetical protein